MVSTYVCFPHIDCDVSIPVGTILEVYNVYQSGIKVDCHWVSVISHGSQFSRASSGLKVIQQPLFICLHITNHNMANTSFATDFHLLNTIPNIIWYKLLFLIFNCTYLSSWCCVSFSIEQSSQDKHKDTPQLHGVLYKWP